MPIPRRIVSGYLLINKLQRLYSNQYPMGRDYILPQIEVKGALGIKKLKPSHCPLPKNSLVS
jgi:hypothetical protein